MAGSARCRCSARAGSCHVLNCDLDAREALRGGRAAGAEIHGRQRIGQRDEFSLGQQLTSRRANAGGWAGIVEGNSGMQGKVLLRGNRLALRTSNGSGKGDTMSVRRLARVWRGYSQTALCSPPASGCRTSETIRWYCGFFSGWFLLIVVIFLHSFGEATIAFTR